MESPAPGAASEVAKPEVAKPEWFERIPWTTVFAVSLLYFKDKAYLVYDVKSNIERWKTMLGFQVDIGIITKNDWIGELYVSANYHSYSLTTRHIHTAIFGIMSALSLLMFTIHLLLGEKKAPNAYSSNDKINLSCRLASRKRLSNALTIFNIVVVSFMATGYLIEYLDKLDDAPSFFSWFMTCAKDIWSGWTNIGTMFTIWLVIFNIMEIIWCYKLAKEHYWLYKLMKWIRPAKKHTN